MPLRPAPAPAPPAQPAHLERHRLALDDGASTTVHVARYDLARFRPRVVRLRRPKPLQIWCAKHGVREALVGGFYARPHGTPLGELRTSGIERRHVGFDEPWSAIRACLHVHRGTVTIAARAHLAVHPRGDLLQAGPLLVSGGRPLARDGEDPEGFSVGAGQFDSDITVGRYPRAALGYAPGRMIAVACDGRADDEAGLTLGELAEMMAALGCLTALNLDGGGSTSLICEGRLRNTARESHGVQLPHGRAVSTAVVFSPRV